MRYFHRTSLPLDDVLAEADNYFGSRLAPGASETRSRTWQGTIGQVDLRVEAEGGHYTLVTVATDQVGESEADKLAKGFLTRVHMKVDPGHVARGAY
jgi:hypothetical protein